MRSRQRWWRDALVQSYTLQQLQLQCRLCRASLRLSRRHSDRGDSVCSGEKDSVAVAHRTAHSRPQSAGERTAWAVQRVISESHQPKAFHQPQLRKACHVMSCHSASHHSSAHASAYAVHLSFVAVAKGGATPWPCKQTDSSTAVMDSGGCCRTPSARLLRRRVV